MNNNFYQQFNENFTNIVYPSKVEMVDKLQNMSCSGDIMLEPRLQEYLKKKKYYKDNSIEPCISLEKEFLITSFDIKLLRTFLSGKKDIYDKDTYNKLAGNNNTKKYFPSKEFRNDKRIPEIEKSKKTHKIPSNQGMFVPDNNGRYYEEVDRNDNNSGKMMDARDFPKMDGRGFDLNETKFSPRIDPKIYRGKEEHNKYESQYRIPPDPRNDYIISDISKNKNNDNNNDNKNLFNSNTYHSKYGSDTTPTYSSMSDMDMDNKLVIPNIASKSKKDMNSGEYRFEPYYTKGDKRNAEMENNLARGMPSYRPKNKSYGYRNPSENYYNYIDEDYQVESWTRGGEATRLDNKNPARNKPYNREIV